MILIYHWGILSQLSDKHQYVVRHVYVDDITQMALAEELRVTKDSVSKWIKFITEEAHRVKNNKAPRVKYSRQKSTGVRCIYAADYCLVN